MTSSPPFQTSQKHFIIWLNRGFKIAGLSRDLLEVLNTPVEQWVGKSPDALLHSESAKAKLSDWLNRTATNGEAANPPLVKLHSGLAEDAWFRPQLITTEGLEEVAWQLHLEATFDQLLLESYELARQYAEEAYLIVDPALKIIDYNESFGRQYQMILNSIPERGESVLQYTRPERREMLTALYQQVLGGEEQKTEVVVTDQQGQGHHILNFFKPIRSRNGDVNGVFVASRDITEIRTAEQEQRLSMARYQNLLQSIDGIVWEARARDRKLSYISSQAENILGYTPEEWLKDPRFWEKKLHPEDRDHAMRKFRQAVDQKKDFRLEYRMQHAHGHYVWCRDMIRQFGHEEEKDNILRGIILDITEIQEAQKARDLERHKFMELLNLTDDLMWSVSHDFKLITANEPFLNEMLHTSGKHLAPGDSVLEGLNLDPRFVEYWRELYQRALSGKSYRIEVESPAGDKSPQWYETSFKPIVEQDQVTGIVCHSRNVTETKSYQRQLVDSNKKLSTAQRIARLGYWQLDLQTNQLYWSPEVYEIWQADPMETDLSLQFFVDSLHPEDRENFLSINQKVIDGELEQLNHRHRIQTARGEVRWIHERGEVTYDAAGQPRYLEGTAQDITHPHKAYLALERQNEFIETVLNRLPLGIAVNTTADGKAVVINEKFSEIYGWPAEDIPSVDAFFEKVYPDPENRANIRKWIESAMASGDPAQMEFHHVEITTKSGDKRIVNAKNIPLPEQGLVISSVMDVTDEVEAKRERERILESISDAFYSLDEEWRFNYFNQEAERLLEKSAQEVLSREIWELLPVARETELYERYHQAMHHKVPDHFEYYYPPQKSWYEISVYPRPRGISVFFRNINERKRYERKLKKLNRSLENRAAELARSNAELEQFAYVASHDLQEPLRMVTSFLGQLQRKYQDQLDDKAGEYMRYAMNGAHRMRQVILDLLDYSRIDRLEQAPEVVDLNELMEEIRLIQAEKLEQNQGILSWDHLPEIKASRARLERILQNLVSNALKYSRANTPPQIKVSARAEKAQWKFCVEDNGLGIEPEYFDKIFVIFQRLHTADEYSGTGIGLAITKKIVEQLKGHIWVESTPGAGSRFYFTLPR